MVMGFLSLLIDAVLVVENSVTVVLGFCAELLLSTYAELLREEFMVSEAEITWLWGSHKQKMVDTM